MSPELLDIRQEGVRLLAATLAEETGIPVAEILGDGRDAQVVAVRHRLWAMLHGTGLSLTAIGMITGRHHTTILHAIRKVTRVRVSAA